MSRDYHTRLPPDHAEAVDQYAEDHGVKKSEVLRRAVKEFFDTRPYPRDEGKRVVADGSGRVVRPMLRGTGAIYAAVGLLGTIAIGLQIPVLSVESWFKLMLSGYTLTALTMIVLYTRIPEWIDWKIAQHGRRLAARIRGVRT